MQKEERKKEKLKTLLTVDTKFHDSASKPLGPIFKIQREQELADKSCITGKVTMVWV